MIVFPVRPSVGLKAATASSRVAMSPIVRPKSSVRIPLQTSENRPAKLDGPMTFGYGIDATDAARKKQRCGTNICFSRRKAGRHNDDRPLVTLGLEKIYTEGGSIHGFKFNSL